MFVTARPLHELVEEGWARALEPVGPQVAQMGEFLRTELAAGHRYLPAGPNVLRAFRFPVRARSCAHRRAGPVSDAGSRRGPELLGGSRRAPVTSQPGQHLHRILCRSRFPAADERRPDTVGGAGVMLLNRVLTVAPGDPASIGARVGRGDGVRDPGAGGPGPANGRGAVGPGRRDTETDARRQRVRVHRVAAPLAAVGPSGVLRLAAVQPRQRATGEDGRRPDRLAASLAQEDAKSHSAARR